MLLNFYRRGILQSHEGNAGAGNAGAGAGSTGAQGGAQFTPPDLTNAEVKKWFDSQVQGLAANKEAILAEKRRLEENYNALQAKVKPLGDLDKLGEQLKKMGDAEDTQLLREGKVEELVSRRLTAAQKRHEEALSLKDKDLAKFQKALEEKQAKVRELTIDRAITEAAVKLNVHKTALKDVLTRGRQVFSLTDDYKIQAVDGSGIIINAPDGRTPLNPESWVESLREEAPHLFPASSGTNSRGNTAEQTSSGPVIRLRPGYTQEEFEQADKQAKASGARLVFPSRG